MLPDRVPVGGRGKANLNHLALSSQASVTTPSVCQDLPQARVNVVQQGVMPQGVKVPKKILADALKGTIVQKFSGRPEDFEDFERQWNLHLKMIYGASQGTELADVVVLMTLRQYLDEASSAMLDGRLNVDPDLSYYDFWDDMRSRYLRDARMMHRQNWRSIRLGITGNRCSLQDWAKFQALYVAKRSLVEDWTETEDQQHVFSQVPPQFQPMILRETGKRRNGKRWIRVVVPPGETLDDIRSLLHEATGFKPGVVSTDKRHFVVDCASDHEMSQLLACDGAKVEGKVVKIQRAEYSMSGDDMLAFVRRHLEEAEELDIMRRSYGGIDPPPPPPRSVRQVQSEKNSSPRREVRYESSSDRESSPRSWKDSKQPRKGKGKGKGSRKTQSVSSSTPPPRGKGGRAASSNPHGRGRGKGRGDPPQSGICYTCRDLGRNPNHNYQDCQISQAVRKDTAEKKAKKDGSQGSSPKPTQKSE